MPEEASHVESVELDHRPGSVDQRSEQVGKFPFEAFEFTSPSAATPIISLKSPWVMNGKLRARYAP